MKLKQWIAMQALPIVRLWIRYAPTSLWKQSLVKMFFWRGRNFQARTRFGIQIKGRSNDVVQGFVYYFGIWEPNLTYWIRSRLREKPEFVFIDVGANVGYFTTLVAAGTSGRGRVVAVEPSPRCYRMLCENIAINGLENVRAVSCAAMADEGPVLLYPGSAENLGETTTLADGSGSGAAIAVEVSGRPLSRILSDDDIRSASLFKIDVEGAEWSALQGLLPVFDKLPADVEFAIEISQDRLGIDQLTQLFEMFTGRGFAAYAWEDSNHPLVSRLKHAKPPTRIRSLPVDRTDVVFSRIDAEHL